MAARWTAGPAGDNSCSGGPFMYIGGGVLVLLLIIILLILIF